MSDEDLTKSPEVAPDSNRSDDLQYSTGDNTETGLATGSVAVAPANQAYVPEKLEKQFEDVDNAVGEPKEVDVDFSIVNHLDPRRQLDPHGVYLDDVQRLNAEIERARREGREPDLENPPPYAGDVVVQTEVAKASGTYPGSDFPVAFTAPVVVGIPSDEDEDVTDEVDETSDETSEPKHLETI